MEKLMVKENKIVNTNGEEVILKGISINSPGILKYEENHDFLQDIREIKKLGANAVRVPICPAYFLSKEDYLEEILDPIVNLAKELEIYCLLTYHGQGNPKKKLVREPNMLINDYRKYDADSENVKKSVEILAKRYGKEEHVLFEPLSAYFLEVTKEDFIGFSTELLKIIRKYSNNLVVISAVDWPQTLEFALDYSSKFDNIAFGIMVYPGTTNEIKEIILKVKEKFPIIVTECGYEEINPKEEVLAGTKDYAIALKPFLEDNKLSFFAWVYHPKRQPVVLRSWNPDDLSEWGTFLKEELLGEVA